jgi:hypothetical protein
LQRLGAGPKTLAALRELSESSASLPAAAPARAAAASGAPAAAAIPAPDPAEVSAALAEIREKAVDYSKNLPNYICAQVTKRHVDPTGSGNYRLADTIIEKLTYFEQKEDYKVIMINDRPVTTAIAHNQLGGAKSSGEFGSILHTIFDPAAQTEFQWERWATLRTRRAYVFAFRVRQPRYSIEHEGSKRAISVGFHGLIFADREDKTVRRVQMECDDIPADFPIQSVTLGLDYDAVDIAGQEFVLPMQSEVRSREGKYLAWNEVSYHNYNKFGADVNITFDTPDSPPPAKKKD